MDIRSGLNADPSRLSSRAMGNYSRGKYETEDAIRLVAPEQDLDNHVWPGDIALHTTCICSEVRSLLFHYNGQRLDRTGY
jgi:hypothetical protein